MAKYQYRLGGSLNWMSNSGNALFAILNPAGSNKKLTLRSLELANLTGLVTNAGSMLSVALVGSAGRGESVPITKMDSDAGDWPSTVLVESGTSTSSVGTPIKRVQVHKTIAAGGLQDGFARQRSVGKFRGISSMPRAKTSSGPVTGIVLAAGETLAVVPTVFNRSVPLKFDVTMVRSGSPGRTYVASGFGSVLAQDVALVSIANQAGSGETITVREIAVSEVGTSDTPYFQIVPCTVDSLSSSDPASTLSLTPMDSNYPSPTSWIVAVQDAAVFPVGLPENAIADSSTGSPKGFNYFKTKDFLGPVYRTVFPEMMGIGTGALGTFGSAPRMEWTDLLVRRSGIVLREGEAIALVSGAETAVLTTPIGVSGWSSWRVGVMIDVEPKLSPTLSITGLQNPSEVRIYDAGTTTAVAGQEDVTTGIFSWTFDPDEYPEVDIAILSLGYQNIRLTNFALTLADVTIPVQQQVDRQYQN